MAIGLNLWAGRKYYLNKMTLRELLVAYFTHHSILTYLALIAVSIWLAVVFAASPGPPLLAALVIVLIYPLVEYLMHRYVLHSRMLYRYKATAALWKWWARWCFLRVRSHSYLGVNGRCCTQWQNS